MRKFQIVVIAHSLKGNKVARSGDIVFENQLTSPADDLILAGFIKEVESNDNELILNKEVVLSERDLDLTEKNVEKKTEKEVIADLKKEVISPVAEEKKMATKGLDAIKDKK